MHRVYRSAVSVNRQAGKQTFSIGVINPDTLAHNLHRSGVSVNRQAGKQTFSIGVINPDTLAHIVYRSAVSKQIGRQTDIQYRSYKS